MKPPGLFVLQGNIGGDFDYWIWSNTVNIGRYIASRIEPTIPPTTTIIAGSNNEVSAFTMAPTSILEPAMIMVVGGIVGSILLAMYLPIFTVFDQIQ